MTAKKKTAKKKKTGGRRLSLTAEVIVKITEMIRRGCTVETAVVASAVGKTTYYTWLAKAEDDDEKNPIYRELRDAVKIAEAEFEDEALSAIREAATPGYETERIKIVESKVGDKVTKTTETIRSCKRTWTAAAWLLERKWPERYGRRDVTQIKGEGTVELGPADFASGVEFTLTVVKNRDEDETEGDTNGNGKNT